MPIPQKRILAESIILGLLVTFFIVTVLVMWRWEHILYFVEFHDQECVIARPTDFPNMVSGEMLRAIDLGGIELAIDAESVEKVIIASQQGSMVVHINGGIAMLVSSSQVDPQMRGEVRRLYHAYTDSPRVSLLSSGETVRYAAECMRLKRGLCRTGVRAASMRTSPNGDLLMLSDDNSFEIQWFNSVTQVCGSVLIIVPKSLRTPRDADVDRIVSSIHLTDARPRSVDAILSDITRSHSVLVVESQLH